MSDKKRYIYRSGACIVRNESAYKYNCPGRSGLEADMIRRAVESDLSECVKVIGESFLRMSLWDSDISRGSGVLV